MEEFSRYSKALTLGSRRAKSESEGHSRCWPWSSWENCARDHVVSTLGFQSKLHLRRSYSRIWEI